jgi:transposase InsO family protein
MLARRENGAVVQNPENRLQPRQTPLSLEDARRLVAQLVAYYNTVLLHSAIAYITPADKLAGHAEAIWAARRQKLAAAEATRRAKTKDSQVDQSQCYNVH